MNDKPSMQRTLERLRIIYITLFERDLEPKQVKVLFWVLVLLGVCQVVIALTIWLY